MLIGCNHEHTAAAPGEYQCPVLVKKKHLDRLAQFLCVTSCHCPCRVSRASRTSIRAGQQRTSSACSQPDVQACASCASTAIGFAAHRQEHRKVGNWTNYRACYNLHRQSIRQGGNMYSEPHAHYTFLPQHSTLLTAAATLNNTALSHRPSCFFYLTVPPAAHVAPGPPYPAFDSLEWQSRAHVRQVSRDAPPLVCRLLCPQQHIVIVVVESTLEGPHGRHADWRSRRACLKVDRVECTLPRRRVAASCSG